MERRKKSILFNILNVALGGVVLNSESSIVRGFTQSRVDFCEKCGKVLDREGDPSSIKRGDVCLECSIEYED